MGADIRPIPTIFIPSELKSQLGKKFQTNYLGKEGRIEVNAGGQRGGDGPSRIDGFDADVQRVQLFRRKNVRPRLSQFEHGGSGRFLHLTASIFVKFVFLVSWKFPAD